MKGEILSLPPEKTIAICAVLFVSLIVLATIQTLRAAGETAP